MTFNAKALGMTGVYLLVFVLAAFLVDSGSSPIGSLLIAAVVVVGGGWGFVASAKLNGWQRLWIVLSVLWFVPVLGVSYLWWPTGPPDSFWERADLRAVVQQADAQRERQDKITTDKGNRATTPMGRGATSMKYAVTRPDGRQSEVEGDHVPTELELNRIYASIGGTRPPLVPPTSQRAETWPSITAAVRWRQARFVGEAVAGWTLPLAALYLFGLAVAWVRRGFATQ
jgi:hypothetical protein